MINQRLHKIIRKYGQLIQRFADRIWFPPLIFLLAAMDNFLIFIPTEGILISGSMVVPRRWFLFALCVAIGSTVGALVLVYLVELHGLPWILEIFPGINKTKIWSLAFKFFEEYGLIVVFLMGITPFSQQPAIILASLADTPIGKFAAAIFFGRLIKFSIMSYVGTHAPKLLSKMWGVKDELSEIGVEIKE